MCCPQLPLYIGHCIYMHGFIKFHQYRKVSSSEFLYRFTVYRVSCKLHVKKLCNLGFEFYLALLPTSSIPVCKNKTGPFAIYRGKKIIMVQSCWRYIHEVYKFTCTHLLQMLPLLKTTTDNLVAVIEEKATSKQTFEVLRWIGLR